MTACRRRCLPSRRPAAGDFQPRVVRARAAAGRRVGARPSRRGRACLRPGGGSGPRREGRQPPPLGGAGRDGGCSGVRRSAVSAPSWRDGRSMKKIIDSAAPEGLKAHPSPAAAAVGSRRAEKQRETSFAAHSSPRLPQRSLSPALYCICGKSGRERAERIHAEETCGKVLGDEEVMLLSGEYHAFSFAQQYPTTPVHVSREEIF